MLWRVAIASMVVFALSAASGYAIVYRLIETPETQAPDLLALTVDEAVEKASADNFSVLIEKKEMSELLDPGRILSQRPAPGTWVKEGSRIRLTIAAKR